MSTLRGLYQNPVKHNFLLYPEPPARVIEVGGDKEFYEYLRSIGKSENTAKNYCDKVRIYNQWCVDSFGTIPLTLFRANVLDYISYMRNIKSYHPKSVNNHLSSLRAYNEFLISSGCQTEMAILKNDFMKVQVQYREENRK